VGAEGCTYRRLRVGKCKGGGFTIGGEKKREKKRTYSGAFGRLGGIGEKSEEREACARETREKGGIARDYKGLAAAPLNFKVGDLDSSHKRTRKPESPFRS